MTSSLKDYEFGYAAAEEEGAYAPKLLLAGYHDPESLISKAIEGRSFIFLGYKGSGKSAIGEHIRLIAQDRHNLFVTLVTLADFPFTPFSKILKGDMEPEAKYPTAWCWLLLLYLFESFTRDNARQSQDEKAFQDCCSDLKELGLLPNPTFRRTVLTSSKSTFGATLWKVTAKSERTYERQDTTDFAFFVDSLKQIAFGINSPNRHLFIIDGLDDILTKRDVRYDALSALAYEANRLNQALAMNHVPAKIIILCRTDLFERLPGANTNKLRQDATVNLDWYRDSQNPAGSDLIRLINMRAQISSKSNIDVFAKHFPERMERLHKGESQDTRSFLLDLTRHTPRDIIVLMKNLQTFATKEVMTRDQILKGATAYSKDYFVPEIKNELSGYVPDGHISVLIELLGALRKREFFVYELEAQCRRSGAPAGLDVHLCLKYLFECSALGNVETWPSGQTFFTFRYRNRHSAFNPNKKVLLHFGIWKALNLL
jgi:hypothetical protein